MNTNEIIYGAYQRSGWTHDRFFERLSKDCLSDAIIITRSAYDSWRKSGDSVSHRSAPDAVAGIARLIDPRGDELQASMDDLIYAFASAGKRQVRDVANQLQKSIDDPATQSGLKELQRELLPWVRKQLRKY